MIYYIVEVFYSKTKVIGQESDLKRAKKKAAEHSAKTGLIVEIQNEMGKTIEHEVAWRE